MKNILNILQVIFASAGGYLGWFLGGFDGFMYALIAFVIIDYLTGVMLAIIKKKLSSEIGFKGIIKKILIFVMVGVANIIDENILKQGCAIRTSIIFFYLSNEGISIIENSANMGLPIPNKLKSILKQINIDEKDKTKK